jgi:hypothetical protein
MDRRKKENKCRGPFYSLAMQNYAVGWRDEKRGPLAAFVNNMRFDESVGRRNENYRIWAICVNVKWYRMENKGR